VLSTDVLILSNSSSLKTLTLSTAKLFQDILCSRGQRFHDTRMFDQRKDRLLYQILHRKCTIRTPGKTGMPP
jgi:hypothetical protein